MSWGDRASTRYVAELIEKKAGPGRWLGAILKVVVANETPNADVEFEFLIKDKRTGAVVHREMGNSLTGEEALRLAEERLEQMSPAEFADAYSLQPPAE
ncbi:MAG: hypothetical protein ACRDKG_03660 [Actinomycetota bacterium]